MIDTHAHLDFEQYDQDRDEVIRRAFDNGIKKIINVGVDLERSRKSIELAERHENIYASAGLHPDFFTQHETRNLAYRQAGTKQDWIGELRELAKNKKVVAVGEIGLDYFHVTRNTQHETRDLEIIKENQKKGFLAQIKIAKELGLPVIVHCRDYPVDIDLDEKDGKGGAWEDLFEIISKFSHSPNFSKVRPFLFGKHKRQDSLPAGRQAQGQTLTKFVLHCYSGEKKDTEKFLKLPNVYFSFSGNITYPKSAGRAEKLAEAIRMIPLDRIMLDSDSPFLAPQSVRGKRNEPKYISDIAEKIGEIKGISADKAERATDTNAMKFFALGELGA